MVCMTWGQKYLWLLLSTLNSICSVHYLNICLFTFPLFDNEPVHTIFLTQFTQKNLFKIKCSTILKYMIRILKYMIRLFEESLKLLSVLTCKTMIPTKTPHAMVTLNLLRTITQPPNWPIRLTITNRVARK